MASSGRPRADFCQEFRKFWFWGEFWPYLEVEEILGSCSIKPGFGGIVAPSYILSGIPVLN